MNKTYYYYYYYYDKMFFSMNLCKKMNKICEIAEAESFQMVLRIEIKKSFFFIEVKQI